MSQPINGPRPSRPGVRWLVLCAFFLGIFSMHVLGTAGSSGGIHGSAVHATVAAVTPTFVETRPMIHAPGHGQGVGLGECAVAGACALGLMLLAFKLALPAAGTKRSRSWPLNRLGRLFQLTSRIPAAPAPQRLGICRR